MTAQLPIRRRLVDRIGVSTQELHFVELLQLGLTPALAARQAGIDEQASEVIKRPAVRVLLREKNYCELHGALLPLSIRTAKKILEDPTSPDGAKVAVIKAVWAATGVSPTGQKPLESRPVAPGEDVPEGASVPALGSMEATLKDMQSRLAGMAEQLMRAEPIDVSPGAASSEEPETSFFDV